MKPRVRLDGDTFVSLAKAEQNRVIRTAPFAFRGQMYVTEDESYYYYTYSKEPLILPKGVEVVDAKFFAF